MRLYLETKVVKVKKEKRKCIGEICIRGKCKPLYEADHYIYFEGTEKGNWVNGENIDKIQFPCFCKFGGNQYGMITKTKANEVFDNEFYTLHGIEKQHSSFSSVRSYYNFEDLIRFWDIHILKGKIILFEEK